MNRLPPVFQTGALPVELQSRDYSPLFIGELLGIEPMLCNPRAIKIFYHIPNRCQGFCTTNFCVGVPPARLELAHLSILTLEVSVSAKFHHSGKFICSNDSNFFQLDQFLLQSRRLSRFEYHFRTAQHIFLNKTQMETFAYSCWLFYPL